MFILCIAFAILTGLVYTTAVLIIAIPAHRAKRRGREVGLWARRVQYLLYIGLNSSSVVPLVASTHNGPVAVAVPVVLASQLLSNMVAQVVAGSLTYTKQMRVGTYVLTVSAIQLIDVGPSDARHAVSPSELLARPEAMCYAAVLVVGLLCGAITLPLVRDKSPDSLTKLFVYAIVIGVSSALNNSLSKVVTMLQGIPMYLGMFIYVSMGAVSTIGSADGNAGLNNAISIPVFTCTQLAINGITGVCIWGDMDRTPKKIAYFCVYVLIMSGIYLCSAMELDLLARSLRRVKGDDGKNLVYEPLEEGKGLADCVRGGVARNEIGLKELEDLSKIIESEIAHRRRVAGVSLLPSTTATTISSLRSFTAGDFEPT